MYFGVLISFMLRICMQYERERRTKTPKQSVSSINTNFTNCLHTRRRRHATVFLLLLSSFLSFILWPIMRHHFGAAHTLYWRFIEFCHTMQCSVIDDDIMSYLRTHRGKRAIIKATVRNYKNVHFH